MNLLNPRRNELSSTPFLNNALDWVLSRINAIWLVEHTGEGGHADITASSLTLTENADTDATGDATVDGDVTAGGTGTFDGNVTADADGSPVIIGQTTLLDTGIDMQDVAATSWWTMGAEVGTFSSAPSLLFRDYANRNTVSSVMGLVRRSAIGASPTDYVLEPTNSATLNLSVGRDVSNARINEVNAKTIRANTAYYERGRSVAVGEWQTQAYSAGHFTADVGTWTVDSGDVLTNRYMLSGKTLFWKVTVSGSDVSNTGAVLRMTLPAGLTIATTDWGTPTTRVRDAGGAIVNGAIAWSATNTYVSLYATVAAGTWTATTGDNTDVLFSVEIEVT